MLTISIIAVLYVCGSGLLYYALRRQAAPLSLRQCFFFLGLRITAGSAYGYVYGKYYHGDDTWGLNHDAWLQYQRLLHTPGLFFRDLVSPNPTPPIGLYFQDDATWLEKLEHAFTTKLLAPFNCISQGNYYINVVFFSLLSCWGAYLLYRLLAEQFRAWRPALATALFCFLPALFWLSGIRAEGLILLFTGGLLQAFGRWTERRRFITLLLGLICLGLLFILRSSFAVTLLPALCAWWISLRYAVRPYKAFGWTYGILLCLVLISSFLPPPYNLLRYVVQQQQAFLALHGNTRFNLTPLEYNAGSFVFVAPEAFINTLLRPWPWEAKGALQWLVAGENIVLWCLAIVTITRYGRSFRAVFRHPLAWVLLVAALSNYLLIGYIVPFPGAIVRYRVLGELFLLCLMGLAWTGNSPSERTQ